MTFTLESPLLQLAALTLTEQPSFAGEGRESVKLWRDGPSVDVANSAELIDLRIVDLLTDPSTAALVRAALAEIAVPAPISAASAGHDQRETTTRGWPSVALPQQLNHAHERMGAEPLVALPKTCSLTQPHPYEALGAPYEGVSPFQVRQSVSERLAMAQAWLSARYPGYRLQIFDAYRPVTVQAFMVNYSLAQSLAEHGVSQADYEATPDAPLHQQIRRRVSEIWSQPSMDAKTPPPHATGAAVDLTVVDGQGQPLDMGCPIDDLGPQSEANFYVRQQQLEHPAQRHRLLLHDCMVSAGFKRLPHEWWHFSFGDQWWALLHYLHEAPANLLPTASTSSQDVAAAPVSPLEAFYGRFDIQ